jgi:hypothetical protein
MARTMRDNQDEIIAVAESEIPRGLRHAGSWSDKDECDGSVLWVGSEWTAHGSEVETISADGGEWIYATEHRAATVTLPLRGQDSGNALLCLGKPFHCI